VRWDASGTAVTELENLGTNSNGSATGRAVAINAAGIAVGYAEAWAPGDNFLGKRAVAWGLDGFAIDLNTLLDPGSAWVLTEASGISDTNWVSGLGTFDPDGPGGKDAYGRLFLLNISSAVPEPAGLAMIGLAGAILARRRR
jgi:hypothetical protein